MICHFIPFHLQEPDRFRAAVMRNPVTSINAMLPVTDIPDWCFVETLGTAGVAAYSDVPSAAELQAFLKASPISYVDKVSEEVGACLRPMVCWLGAGK